MTRHDESADGTSVPPLHISRTFDAPPARVFAAWCSTEVVRLWFCPTCYSVPDARVEARVGGPFEVCMRAPDGSEHWTRGSFLEVVAERRLVIEMRVGDDPARPLFTALTMVDFSSVGAGTRVDIEQRYTLFAAAAQGMVGGAAAGWGQTLDRLESLLADRQH